MKNKILLSSILVAFTSCSKQQYASISKIGSSALGQTGVVSESQASSMFEFGGAVGSSLEKLTDEHEYYIGRAVSAHILSRYTPLNNPGLNRYLEKVATVVANASSKPQTFAGYKVQVLDSNEINALSAPGGFIFITKGFLRIVPNEDALAALMAHEVAHIANGHGIAAIKSANLTGALVKLGKANTPSQISAVSQQLTEAFGSGVEDIVASLLSKGYSRSQEYDSDEYAANLLKLTGYNPNGLSQMLTSLKNASQSASDGGWTKTHPSAEDRLDELDESNESAANSNQTIRDKRFKAAIGKL